MKSEFKNLIHIIEVYPEDTSWMNSIFIFVSIFKTNLGLHLMILPILNNNFKKSKNYHYVLNFFDKNRMRNDYESILDKMRFLE